MKNTSGSSSSSSFSYVPAASAINNKRRTNNNKNSSEEKLTVTIRIRPQQNDGSERCVFVLNDKTIVLEEEDKSNDVLRHGRNNEKHYVFDFVFGEDSLQKTVYDLTTKSLVKDILAGYNGTVFAYGATGSGKTYTMIGQSSKAQPGIMVQAVNDLFSLISARSEQFKITISYLEIYNENIRDLLNPNSGFLELREDPNQDYPNIHVAGLTEITATSTEQVLEFLEKGNQERTIESTAVNSCSSRSHAILSITVKRMTEVHGREGLKTRIRQGKLFMIDLAGSERASQTKNRGKRLQEGAHINRSLLALGNCINALSGGTNPRYINYRDSKLTRLLREPLSGNCRTVMIAHVSPSGTHREETRNTLAYASRAAGISNKVERNEMDVSFHVSQYRSIISDLRTEITQLQSKVSKNSCSSSQPVEHNSAKLEAKKTREQIITVFREQMKLRRRLMDIDGHLLSLGIEAERQHQLISRWESRNNKLYSVNGAANSNRRSKSERGTPVNNTDGWNEDDYFNMNQAWAELNYIEREQERYISLRSKTIKELDEFRQKAVTIENELPLHLDSETEKELLSLLCRVHELEADKIALQGERLIEAHELRRRGELLAKYQKQQKISDGIVSKQKQIIEEEQIPIPADLRELYKLYQREIYLTVYNGNADFHNDIKKQVANKKQQSSNKPENDLFSISSKKHSNLPKVKDEINRNVQHSGNRSVSESNTVDYGRKTNDEIEEQLSLPVVRKETSVNNKRSLQPSPIPAAVLFPPITL